MPTETEQGRVAYHDQARVSETFASSRRLSPSRGTLALAVQVAPDSNLVSSTSNSRFLSAGVSVAALLL